MLTLTSLGACAPALRTLLRGRFIRRLLEASLVNQAVWHPILTAPFLRDDLAGFWILYDPYDTHNASP